MEVLSEIKLLIEQYLIPDLANLVIEGLGYEGWEKGFYNIKPAQNEWLDYNYLIGALNSGRLSHIEKALKFTRPIKLDVDIKDINKLVDHLASFIVTCTREMLFDMFNVCQYFYEDFAPYIQNRINEEIVRLRRFDIFIATSDYERMIGRRVAASAGKTGDRDFCDKALREYVPGANKADILNMMMYSILENHIIQNPEIHARLINILLDNVTYPKELRDVALLYNDMVAAEAANKKELSTPKKE